ncbi:hypothetical protein EON73_04215 [bacterium]|nr:MAG: hypothetical protein EON73_04215 [bacterium]
MTTLKIDIENEQDISAIKEILNNFNVSYQIENQHTLNEKSLAIYEGLKSALQQIRLHQKGEIQLKTLKQGLADLRNEL